MGSAQLQRAFSKENLARAWLWLRSNSDRIYKAHFRPLYAAYSLADDAYLADLGQRLRAGSYQAQHATKIHLPKKSGTLRTVTLLSIEDQIVYQAFTNVIAERMLPRVSKHYYKKNFGHLYGGSSGTWFYRNWTDGYSRFNTAIRAAHAAGCTHSASFDLTACYDSIDHAVLRHFLRKFGLDDDFVKEFLELLSRWTSTDGRIFHGHGIPQGPLSSGMISEVVLHHFDAEVRARGAFEYLRYVDDIRLFAKSERALRQALISLDYISKSVGLFPQTSKIEIHEIRDIEDEIKSVSMPSEAVLRRTKDIDQGAVRARLVELSPRLDVTNETRFKYVLARAAPSTSLALRLLRILETQPHLYPAVANHLTKYPRLAKSVSRAVFNQVRDGEPYFSFKAALLNVALGRTHAAYEQHFARVAAQTWRVMKRKKQGADLRAACLRWCVSARVIARRELQDFLTSEREDPWIRWHGIDSTVGSPIYDAILPAVAERVLRSRDNSVAIFGAHLAFASLASTSMANPQRDINHVAAAGLRHLGLLRSRGPRPSVIGDRLSEICGRALPQFDWQAQLRRKEHARLQRLVVLAHRDYKLSPSAFANAIDVVNDAVVDIVARHDGGVGTYPLGNIGSFIHATTSGFATKYVTLHKFCVEVHALRGRSYLSHAVVRSTGKPTGAVSWNERRAIGRRLYAAYAEIIRLW